MIFQLSDKTRNARERLAIGSPGDQIGHKEMAIVLGCNCEGAASPGYGVVHRALQWCEKEKLLVWRWNKETLCWHCLKDAEKPNDLDGRRLRVHRQAKRNMIVGNTVDYDHLDDTGRARVAVNSVLAAAIHRITGPRIAKRLMIVVKEPYIPEEDALLDACRKRLT